MRVICYVDGFNLYHAIDALGAQHLKWVSLRGLAESLLREGEHLVAVHYFSAYAHWLAGPMSRHKEYVAALRATGVETHIAKFKDKTARCNAACKQQYKTHEEKETDVHFAITFIEDVICDNFDKAIIVSADSDYLPAIRRAKDIAPGKKYLLAAPPKRLRMARSLKKACGAYVEITRGRIEKNLLPPQITDGQGKIVARRPHRYTPPKMTSAAPA